ncbi:MAG: sirohydrochlorin cobaltochelatase [Proteobacteria bacterium]|nr:sirohydrochlorin cobaltochelatase [Pseudomonadota bacterium]
MFQTIGRIILITFFTLHLIALSATASGNKPPEGKTAILLASFGTTVPSGVNALENITEQVRKAYPGTEVRITFTSNMVRAVWKKRRTEAQKWLGMGIPEEILNVKNIIQAMGDLQEDGYRNIIVQPTHMFYMEQSYDLNNYISALGSIKTLKSKWRPFDTVVMGRPALGAPGDKYSYHEDVDRVIKSLAGDVEMARKEGANLLYMGHGNEYWSTGIYAETEKKMRAAYPDTEIFIGVVEGTPSIDDLLPALKGTKSKKIILKPFMITAGDHAVNDMAGAEGDSWKTILTAEGYSVQPVLEGLGSNPGFVALFVENIADAAKEGGLILK